MSNRRINNMLKRYKITINFLTILLTAIPLWGTVFSADDQTRCYNNGKEIPCPTSEYLHEQNESLTFQSPYKFNTSSDFQSATPTISNISPQTGHINGGTRVTITGANFLSGATVTFGGLPGVRVLVFNGTYLSVSTPAHAAGAVDVTITNPDGQSVTRTTGFTYSGDPPTITSIDPQTGHVNGGTRVTISGTNFTSGASVSFGETVGTGVLVDTDGTNILVFTPTHAAGTVDVTVTNPDGESVIRAYGFTYSDAPPTIANIDPQTGHVNGGTRVTISGANFTSGASVSFGETAGTGILVGTDGTNILVFTPPHTAGSVDVTVTNPDGESVTRAYGFIYSDAPPTFTNIDPQTGDVYGGTAVTITGTNFTSGATVAFGETVGTGVLVGTNGTNIYAFTPAHAAGSVDVIVTNPDGKSVTRTYGYTYTGSLMGDINIDGKIDLVDAILAIQILAGIIPEGLINWGADVNGDGKIGLAEVIYIFQQVANTGL